MTMFEAEALVVPRLGKKRQGIRSSFSLSAMVNLDDNGNEKQSSTLLPPRYIRMFPRTARGSRQCFEVQTAVTTLERTTADGRLERVDLHAQLHLGSPDYFQTYSSNEFASLYDGVLYELLTDETLLEQGPDGLRYLPPRSDGQSPLMASPADQQMARSYGLVCQVDHINYAKPDWIHADLTRQELLQASNNNPSSQQPLWALASTAPTWPGAEAAAALFRPSTPSTSLASPVSRRLFSNLFLPGNALVSLLRASFWFLLPTPELSVMLLDWSSLLPRPTGGVSQVALPVLNCLLTGNLQEARQLVFGQMLVSGQGSSTEETLLVGRRNERALDVLEDSFLSSSSQPSSSSSGTTTTHLALLYGAMHCVDLQGKLRSVGFVPKKTRWRTAWSVRVPQFGTGTVGPTQEAFAATASPAALAVGLVILPSYLAVGGLDWISSIQEVATAVDEGNVPSFLLVGGLYLLRHVLLYLGLAKFVVEWDGGKGLFGNNNDTM